MKLDSYANDKMRADMEAVTGAVGMRVKSEKLNEPR